MSCNNSNKYKGHRICLMKNIQNFRWVVGMLALKREGNWSPHPLIYYKQHMRIYNVVPIILLAINETKTRWVTSITLTESRICHFSSIYTWELMYAFYLRGEGGNLASQLFFIIYLAKTVQFWRLGYLQNQDCPAFISKQKNANLYACMGVCVHRKCLWQ